MTFLISINNRFGFHCRSRHKLSLKIELRSVPKCKKTSIFDLNLNYKLPSTCYVFKRLKLGFVILASEEAGESFDFYDFYDGFSDKMLLISEFLRNLSS